MSIEESGDSLIINLVKALHYCLILQRHLDSYIFSFGQNCLHVVPHCSIGWRLMGLDTEVVHRQFSSLAGYFTIGLGGGFGSLVWMSKAIGNL